jgi:hypothetical protein
MIERQPISTNRGEMPGFRGFLSPRGMASTRLMWNLFNPRIEPSS